MMNNRTRTLLYLLVMALVTIVTYSNHWQNDFHFDDSHTVQNNIYIQSLHNIPCFYFDHVAPCHCRAANTFSSIPSHGSYRPLVVTTLAFDYWMGKGLNPFYFHLSTFIFFLLQGGCMFFFFRYLLTQFAEQHRAAAIAFITTLFFLVHPLCAETINYVISRSDSLSTFFVVLAFVCYQYSERARRLHLYLIPVFIGILAKPTAIMFMPLLAVYHLLFEQQVALFRFSTFSWRRLIVVILPSLVLGLAGYLLIRHMEKGFFESGGYDLFRYVITQPMVYVHYISQAILPSRLSADTDWGTFEKVTEPRALLGFAFLAGLIATAFLTSRTAKLRPVSFGILWFLIALVPTSFVPLAEVMNDHRMFFPMTGLVLALVWSVYQLFEMLNKRLREVHRRVSLPLAVLLISAYAYGTHERNKVWRTEETLWKDVTEKSPKNGRGLMNYGLALMGRGDFAGAEKYFTQGLKMWPYYSYLHINLAIVREQQQRWDEAEAGYLKGIQYGASYPNNYYYYARFLNKRGRKDEAIVQLKRSLQLSDANVFVREFLMDLLYEQSRLEELRSLAESTLRVQPGNGKASNYLAVAQTGKSKLQITEESVRNNPNSTAEEWLNLSLLYYEAGKFEQCIEASTSALKVRPNYAEAWNNICSAHNALGNFAEGAKACREALKLKPDYTLAKNNLAWAEKNL